MLEPILAHSHTCKHDWTYAGVDEAGRGPLAGPVVAGACIMPPHVDIPGIRDSKLMTAAQRENIFQLLTAHPEVICAT